MCFVNYSLRWQFIIRSQGLLTVMSIMPSIKNEWILGIHDRCVIHRYVALWCVIYCVTLLYDVLYTDMFPDDVLCTDTLLYGVWYTDTLLLRPTPNDTQHRELQGQAHKLEIWRCWIKTTILSEVGWYAICGTWGTAAHQQGHGRK